MKRTLDWLFQKMAEPEAEKSEVVEEPQPELMPFPTDFTRKWRVLSADDVSLVVKDVHGAADKWHEIGTAFKMSATFLEELKAKAEGNDAGLLAVIKQWLGGGNARPTWEAMRDVLQSKEVGKQSVADQLDKKYSLKDQNSDAILTPSDMSRPYGCGIKGCVCEQVIEKMTSEFGLKYPYLEVTEEGKETAATGRKELLRRLELEHREVLAHYDNFASFVWRGLVRRSTPTQKIIDFIAKVELFQTFHKLPHPSVLFFSKAIPELKKCTTLTEAFLVLRDYVSVFNHGITVDLLLNMGGNTRDRNELDKFRDRYYNFMRRKATLFPATFTLPVREGCAMARFTVRKDNDKISLSEADSYCNRLTYILDISRFSLKLIGLLRESEGVSTYVYEIPYYAAYMMFPMNDKQVALMRKENIARVACCSYVENIPDPLPEDLESHYYHDRYPDDEEEVAMEVEGGSTAPLYASLPPDSPFRVDTNRIHIPLPLAGLQERTPGTRNYVAIIPHKSDTTLYLAMVLCQHAAERKRKGECIKCLIITNTKPRAHDIAEQMESILPGVPIPVLSGAEKMTIAEKLEPNRDIVAVCTSGKFYYDHETEVLKYEMCSLMLIDECHYAMRRTFLEAGLHRYIVDKVYRSLKPPLPQIVGVTSEPVERCDALDDEAMQRHLMKVASGVDSFLGILFTDDVASDTYVPRGTSKRVPKPVMTVRKVKIRNTQMDMVMTLQVEICKWAESIGLMTHHYKWTAEYSEFIQTQLDAALVSVGVVSDTTPPELAERVRILELLRLFTQAIKALTEFGVESALAVLQASTTGTSAEATKSHLTAAQYDSLNSMKEELEVLKARKNPLVEAVMDVVCAQINDPSTKSRGILFVDSLQDAQVLCAEIYRCMFMCRPYVIPRTLVASYSTNVCAEIEKIEQTTEEMMERGEEGLEAFNTCESRLLIIPYAVEIDSIEIKNIESEFDFIARLHKVSRRDDMAETEHVLSFMLSPYNKSFAELRRDFDMCRLEMGLRALPTEREALKKKLTRGMEDVMFAHQSRYVFSLNRTKKQNEPGMDQIQLRCKKCRVYVCHGMELFSFFVDGGNHCVVPHKDFHTRYHTKPYLAKHKAIKRVNRLHRMYCNSCGAPWGVVCHFPAKGCLLPVLKSKHFIFEMNRKYYAIKLWSDALFKVPPIAAYPHFHIHGTVEAELN